MLPPPSAAASLGLSSEIPIEKVLSKPSELVFPDEFPYEFDFSASLGDSTEIEDEIRDDEDDFFLELTRRLARSTQRLASPSFVTDKLKPQVTESIQNGLGSPNGPFSQAPSPPTTPSLEEYSLKVISAAAEEVAKIKIADSDTKSHPNPNLNPNSVIPFHQNYYYYWLWQPQYYHQSQIRGVPNSWLMSPSPPIRGVFNSTTAVKQPSTGTGVFLPQKDSYPYLPRKKSGGRSVKIPRQSVDLKNPKVEEMSGRCQPHSQAGLSTGPKKNDKAGGCLKKAGKPSSTKMDVRRL